jgi:hypothetical protein
VRFEIFAIVCSLGWQPIGNHQKGNLGQLAETRNDVNLIVSKYLETSGNARKAAGRNSKSVASNGVEVQVLSPAPVTSVV